MDSRFPPEDASAETRELARVIRELGGLLPGSPEVDWRESRRGHREVFNAITRNADGNIRLIELLDGSPYFVGGDEHHIVRVSQDPTRIYKLTHGDNFGCRSYFSAADPEMTGNFHGETNADPFFYLYRWVLLNSINNYQTRFEGFVPPEKPEWLPRICISQPVLPGSNPTPKEIRAALREYGFYEISMSAFFHPGTQVLLTDAAPRNVRVVDGIPIPFDAIAQVASGRVLDWAIAQCERLSSDNVT